MKILKPGFVPEPEKPYWVGVEISCPKCHCVWVLDENDQGPHGLKQEGLNGVPKVKCPTKGCDTRVCIPVRSGINQVEHDNVFAPARSIAGQPKVQIIENGKVIGEQG